ncbi:diguanylate phosphodiesterase [Aeromonas hydrophila]|nr:diguanylate phosphodiesterase [Aeromonas hydrophila]
MDFPAPSAATSKDYDTLIQQLNQLCPLQHFGMLGLSEAGLQWVCEYQISDSFKLQLGLEESRITDQLTQLDEADGWCSLPVEHGQVQWLLACCQPKELPTLRLLLECLAKRLNETQAGSQLSELASPLIRKDPDWQKKIESINRIIRLANTLPSQALFSQLEAVLRQMLAIQDMLLVRIDSHRLEKIYPEQPPTATSSSPGCATAPTTWSSTRSSSTGTANRCACSSSTSPTFSSACSTRWKPMIGCFSTSCAASSPCCWS